MFGQIPLRDLFLNFESFDIVVNGTSGKNHLRSLDGKAIPKMRRYEGLPVRKITIRHPCVAVIGCRCREIYIREISILGDRNLLFGTFYGRLEDFDRFALRVGQSIQFSQAHDLSCGLCRYNGYNPETVYEENNDVSHNRFVSVINDCY